MFRKRPMDNNSEDHTIIDNKEQMNAFTAYINHAFWTSIEPYTPTNALFNQAMDEELQKPYGRKEAFARLMSFGNTILKDDPTLWPDVVRLYLSSVQSAYLTANIMFPTAYHDQISNLFHSTVILFGKTFNNSVWVGFPYTKTTDWSASHMDTKVNLDLSRDIVLPWPWNWDRYQRALKFIGRPSNPWRQDDNHRVTALWPVGIAKVGGGNHSLSMGILRRAGTLTATVVDVSPWIEQYHTDGEAFYDSDNRIVSQYPSLWWAAIWELSRIIITDKLDTGLWDLKQSPRSV